MSDSRTNSLSRNETKKTGKKHKNSICIKLKIQQYDKKVLLIDKPDYSLRDHYSQPELFFRLSIIWLPEVLLPRPLEAFSVYPGSSFVLSIQFHQRPFIHNARSIFLQSINLFICLTSFVIFSTAILSAIPFVYLVLITREFLI